MTAGFSSDIQKRTPFMSNKCFVLIPFKHQFDEYYEHILVPAIKDAGFNPIRADQIYGTEPVINDIFREIQEAKALVADVTGKNANVNYELGIAHTLKKPTVIISQRMEDVPFDYRHIRTIIYNTKKAEWVQSLKNRITKTLQSIGSSLPVPQAPDELEVPDDIFFLPHQNSGKF